MRSKRDSDLSSLIIISPVLVLVLVFSHYSHLTRPFENVLIRIVQPAQSSLFLASQQSIKAMEDAGKVRNLSPEELLEQQTIFEDKMRNLMVENAHLKTLVEETELLEQQVSFLEERSYQAVTARITSRSTESISQTITINAGTAQGLQKGFPVIIENGILIGTINTASDFSSEVLLLTSFASQVNSFVQNESQSPGIIKGEHNLSLYMDFIPQLDAIAPGQSVLTSGIDPHIPKGLVIGQIQEVINEPGSLFQKAIVEPFFDSSELSIVSIIVQ